MRYSFGLTVGSPDWERLKQGFVDSFENKNSLYIGPKRKQNRSDEHWDNYTKGSFYTGHFKSETDTDFILPKNKDWAEEICQSWKKSATDKVEVAPVVFAGQDQFGDRELVKCMDKSQDKDLVACGAYTRATAADLNRAAEIAAQDPDGWRELPHKQRHKILCDVANEFRKNRDNLIGVAAAEVGKVFTETDVEVSEAIDFLEFYSHSVSYFENFGNLKMKPKGVGLVTPPWNFPIAIPVGGLAASLAAGNTVILKPASDAVLCGYELCKRFWDAGISKNILQFVPCPGPLAGEHLVKNSHIDYVILTGGEDTAMRMLESRPQLFLSAETGGKDATIVTALADRDQAISNIVQSAFSNSGQKCSATSLLILENEVYFDPKFREALVDAARSLNVGSVWEFKNKLGTLANELSGDLKTAIESLEQGESWVLAPEFAHGNKYMLKPSIKWGVARNSFSHMTELFGPVLSVMRADNLKHAIELVNDTGYGLTSGIESLDEREVAYWKDNIRAGNLYINRGTTGAIVLRQPFGGLGKSAIGAGRKAGAYNYVTQFMEFEESKDPRIPEVKTGRLVKILESWATSSKFQELKQDIARLKIALQSYINNFESEFSKEHDFFKLRGEDNIFKYLKLKRVAIRVSSGDNLFEAVSRVLAAKVAGVAVHVSVDTMENSAVSRFIFTHVAQLLSSEDVLKSENEKDFIKCFGEVDRVIFSKESQASALVFREAAERALFVVRSKPLMEGRLELLNYFEEQSISHSYHRYGNLGNRSLDN